MLAEREVGKWPKGGGAAFIKAVKETPELKRFSDYSTRILEWDTYKKTFIYNIQTTSMAFFYWE